MEENRTRSLSKPKPRPRICVKRRLTNPFKLTKRGSVFARELMNSSRDIDRDFQQPPLLETRHPRAPPSKTSCPHPTTCRPFIYLSNNIFFKKDLENQHQGLSGSAIEYLIWGEESSLGEQADGCNVTSCHRWGYLLRIDPCHQGGSVFPSKETNDRIRVPRRVGDFNAWFRVSRLPSCVPLSIIFVWRNIYHRNWNNFCLRFLSSELLENRISMWFLSSMDFRFYYITFDRRRLMRLLIILSIWRVLRIRNFFKQRWKP